MKMNKKQRGYNLVEIFIVLTVATMMGSWLIANFYEYQKTQRVAETERTIESIKEGLVEYAAQNRAKDFTIIRSYENTLSITNTTLTVTVSWQMPAGRPYLPCPDITGDGIEDRLPLVVLANNELDYSTSSYRVRLNDCYAYKGMVPWRTIGSPSADLWGNHFTYRVDPEFTNSLLGFDQETTSDDSGNQGTGSEPPLTLLTLSSGQIVAARTQVRVPPSASSIRQIILMNNASANVSVAWDTTAARNIEYHPSLICASSPCSYLTPADNLLAGEIATSSVTVATGSYRLDIPVVATLTVGNIINGVPVVILSHGENGYGAIIDDNDDDSQLICRDFPSADTMDYQDERENAQSENDAAGGRCDAISAPTNSRLNGFVKREHAGFGSNIDAESQGFDDIVGWMSTEELRAKLVQQHVFPVEKLPPVGLEGY